jgi:hypothetical protein
VRPEVEVDDGAIRHDVDGAGLHLDDAAGRDPLRGVRGDQRLGQAGDEGGGPAQRVAAQPHRGRAGVVGAAGEGEAAAPHTHDGGDDTDGGARRLELGALLDVELDERRESAGLHARFGDPFGVVAGGCERVGERPAVPAAGGGDVLGGQAGGDGRGPEQAAVAALLVGERDDLHRPRERHALFREAPDALEAGDDAERAVEHAAVRHGVDVRAGPQRRRLGTVEADEDVADGVLAVGEPGRTAAVGEPGARLAVGRGVGGAVDAAGGVAADAAEVLEVGPEPRAVHPHHVRPFRSGQGSERGRRAAPTRPVRRGRPRPRGLSVTRGGRAGTGTARVRRRRRPGRGR